MTATAAHAGAAISIAGDDDPATPSSARLDLAEGENAVAVTVTAQDGATTETYRVTVTRAAAPPPSEPSADPRTLVGNTGQETATGASPVFAFQSVAIQFSAGATGGPWTLAGIRLEVRSWQAGVTPTVSLHAAAGQYPGARIATLTNPSAGTGSKIFSAPSGVTLQPGTAYTAVIESASRSFNGFSLHNTESAAEDGGGGPGWSIADTRLIRQGASWAISSSSLKLKIAVLGTAAASDDATLAALTLADGDGAAVALDPEFAAGTTGYAAAVAHGVSALTVTAAANHDGATVSIAGDDDASTPGSARLALEPGANAVAVTVTAADGETSGTYTVTVTRAAPPAPVPPPSPRTLVGNLGQPVSGSLELRKGQRRAGIKFTTGNSATAWTLTAIRLNVADWHPHVSPSVTLHRVSKGWPGEAIATLANPPRDWGALSFTAPPGLRLQPDTHYAVVVAAEARAGRFALAATGSNDEDGAAGWSIANASRVDNSGAWSWRNRALAMAVEGAPVAAQAAPAGLTGWFVSPPAEHDGSTAFTLRIGFSDPIDAGRAAMRDRAVQVAGGRATAATRVRGSADLWDVDIAPDGPGPVGVALEGGRQCGEAGAVCTEDGRGLADTLALTVPGPLAISVTDASAREGVNSHAIFTILLNRPSTREVTFSYATVDGSARAGEDFYAKSGTGGFSPGNTRFSLSVPVLDDAVDEGVETFTLAVSDPSGAAIADAEGTGTIVNSDPLPKAWIARLGRTVAGQAVDAIDDRLRGGAGSRVAIGGVAVDTTARAAGAGDGAAQAGTVRTMSARQALLGSAFRLAAGGEDGGAGWTAWGRAAHSGFDGAEDGLALDGDVTSGFVGVDVSRARWLAGVAVSLSDATGSFAARDAGSAAGEGRFESSLASVFPYAGYRLGESLDFWGLAGYGSGALTLTRLADASRPRDVATETGLSMRMAAVGARGAVLSGTETGGFDLTVAGDAFWVRMDSDAVDSASSGRMAAARGEASRLRLAARGSRAFEVDGGQVFTPSLELGLRHDGGDAETGAGLDAGAGARLAGRGFALEGAVNALVAHRDRDFGQWGVSGSLSIDPGAAGRGLSLALAPSWGAPPGGAERLWAPAHARELAHDADFADRWRLETEIGFGLGLAGTGGVLTPYAGLAFAGAGERAYRAGAAWTPRPGTALRLQAAHDGGAGGSSLVLRAAARW